MAHRRRRCRSTSSRSSPTGGLVQAPAEAGSQVRPPRKSRPGVLVVGARQHIHIAAPGPRYVRLRLVNAGQESFSGFRLAFTSVVQLTPADESPVRLREQVGRYHEVVAPEDVELAPGGVWDVGLLRCDMHMIHANEGPGRAFVIRSDGSTVPVDVPVTAQGPNLRIGNEAPPQAVLAEADDVTGTAWSTAAECERRLHPKTTSC